ncbi:MAG: helix-turn-helix domain-containing protein [Candidatus Glassbacteria bacterium]|nr:helix-turn-helix domain-containing protein [Candidatus Glassbacteria bacterium]
MDAKGKTQVKWVTISEAADCMPIPVSPSTIRRWIDEGKYGIVGGKFAGRLVVRLDSLPQIRLETLGGDF